MALNASYGRIFVHDFTGSGGIAITVKQGRVLLRREGRHPHVSSVSQEGSREPDFHDIGTEGAAF